MATTAAAACFPNNRSCPSCLTRPSCLKNCSMHQQLTHPLHPLQEALLVALLGVLLGKVHQSVTMALRLATQCTNSAQTPRSFRLAHAQTLVDSPCGPPWLQKLLQRLTNGAPATMPAPPLRRRPPGTKSSGCTWSPCCAAELDTPPGVLQILATPTIIRNLVIRVTMQSACNP